MNKETKNKSFDRLTSFKISNLVGKIIYFRQTQYLHSIGLSALVVQYKKLDING